MEQLVIVLVIAVVSLVKWLMEKSAEQRSQRETEERIDELERQNPRQSPPAPPIRAPRPVASPPLPDMEEASRRLRKALGLPEESELPRPQRRASAPPPPLPRPVETFLERAEPAVAQIEEKLIPPAPPARRAPKPAKHKKSASPAEAPASARSQLDHLLRSRDGLRQVVLAREILGPPKGLEI